MRGKIYFTNYTLCTVERYKLPSDKEQTIVLKSEGNNTVAYLATDLGEVQLHPEVMEYKMGTSPIELLKNVLKTGAVWLRSSAL